MPRFALPTQRALLLAGPLLLGGCAPTLPERPPAPVTTAAPIAPPPSAPRDRDRDGVVDDRDACPDLEGVAPDGCPDPDRDGDSFPDRRDRCPDQTGVEPDGCPIPDSDGDAILDPDDHCPREPETRNGYADHDGCPDPIPAELATITGVLRGVPFELDRDVIRPASRPTLERVVRALEYFPTVRIEVSAQEDGAFAVVDVDTLWRRNEDGALMHWLGRACKGYTRVRGQWLLIYHTGLLEYAAESAPPGDP
jgi:hypothetical protein